MAGDPGVMASARQAFSVLRPACVDVMRAPSAEAVGRLSEALRGVRMLEPSLVEYVLLPIRMAMRRTGG